VNQATLFDWDEKRLPVRRTDPATSLVAAKSVDLAHRKAEVIDAMRLIGVACTADEITAKLAEYGIRMDAGSVRSRLNQLRVDDGKVRKVGVKTVPKPVGTGRPSTTWGLT
jgi:Golgi nucleoside diphosphatase